jgi:hypothetical protein
MVSLLAVAVPVAAQAPLPADVQIELAVQAAPPDRRAEATVQGYDETGAFVVLREGTNDLVCMAPAPAAEAFEVSCHHEGLEAYFARGRELRAQGSANDAATRTRWQEVEDGTLALPYGGVNYILHGSGFDPETREVREPYLRWVIYTPGATPESTGLSAQPSEGAPWLMQPGTPGSHIMITPARERGNGSGG